MKKFIIAITVMVAAFAAEAKTLVVYYSYTQNVERIISALKAQIDCDVIEVAPAEKGLDYAADNYAIGSAQIAAIRNNPDDATFYPAIDPTDVSLKDYDTIIIGSPLWWNQMAAPLQTFLFENGSEMSGKKIGLIVSSASSGISSVEADAKRLIPNGNFLKPSLWIRSHQTPDAAAMLSRWLKEINYAEFSSEPDSERQNEDVVILDEIVAKASAGTRKLRGSATNTDLISKAELSRAACCNLGESFTTNPSVDVNYSDAATGARQIRLLGLSGTYVQMLNENVPTLRGAAAQYGLSFIPGPWIQSIQVSKGASSVKNGYESITGQINVELKKPQADPQLSVNMYYDSENKLEANVDGNLNLGKNWSVGLLTHYEQKFTSHDGDNDGFVDMPKIRQFNFMPRVAYMGSDYVFQAAIKVLDEKRSGGQSDHSREHSDQPLYKIGISTSRLEAFTKNAYIFDRDNDGNIALILSGSRHDSNSEYGIRICDILQNNLYAQLMFERKWNEIHSLSTGLTFNYDNYHYGLVINPEISENRELRKEHESVAGGYAQYTLNLDGKVIAMGGVRYDHSSQYGSMLTPRVHVRYTPLDQLSLHASAGRGYHSPHPYAEYSYLLASSRKFTIIGNLKQESAWNFGAGTSLTFSPGGRDLTFSAEYYYTTFDNQLMVDLDANPHEARVFSSRNRSFSHSLQLEAGWEIFKDFTFTAAWRMNDVKVDYGRGLQQKPLTPKHKALFTASYAPMMGIWQFDVSCAINGGGIMPEPYLLADGQESWARTFKAYPTLNAHITRNFRNWSIYIGGENLTGYRQKYPIIGAAYPWSEEFDATMIYGPLHGAIFYAGFRFNITQYN